MIKFFLKLFTLLVAASLIAVLTQYFSQGFNANTSGNKNCTNSSYSQPNNNNAGQEAINNTQTVTNTDDGEDKFAPAKMMVEMVRNFILLLLAGILLLGIYKHFHKYKPHASAKM